MRPRAKRCLGVQRVMTLVTGLRYYPAISFIAIDLVDDTPYSGRVREIENKIYPGALDTMKNIVRAFVVALVLTGTVATAHSAKSGAIVKNATTASAMPVPCCPPGDPNGCGIYSGQ